MRSKRAYIYPILFTILIFTLGWLAGRNTARHQIDEQIRGAIGKIMLNEANPVAKLQRTVALIEQQYVDSLSADSVVEMAIPALLHKLDPHSVYFTANELKEADEPLIGEFDGIGIVFNMATDTVMVLNVVPSGPSQKAGIMSGDRILYIDDSLVAGRKVSQREIMRRLRGKRGTKVKLGIERAAIDDIVEITVTRDAIPLHSVEAAVMLDKRVGMVRLSQFARTSHAEIRKAIEQLRKEGMQQLILDLRGNAGGYMDQAVLIANEFLERGKMIVYMEDRTRIKRRQFSDGKGLYPDLDVAVLIDESSASSSEILAGALQDNDRGVIVGRRSFGKGLVQTQVPFADGSAVRLTIARYFTPTGRSIQKPYSGDDDKYALDIVERYRHNEFFSADSIRFADSLRFTTPKGRTVYGGGGIMPDRFVPLDTLDVTPYFSEVVGKNILYRYTIEYADRHRKALESAKSVAELKAMLDGDKSLFSDFVRYAERQGVKPNWRDINRSRDIMEAQLRAYISRNSDLEDNAFYYFIYPIDKTVLRAIEELNKTESGKRKTEN